MAEEAARVGGDFEGEQRPIPASSESKGSGVDTWLEVVCCSCWRCSCFRSRERREGVRDGGLWLLGGRKGEACGEPNIGCFLLKSGQEATENIGAGDRRPLADKPQLT